jgi:hypothetical protein
MTEEHTDLVILREEAVLFTAIWNNVVIMFWRGITDNELMDKIEKDGRRARAALSGDYAVFVVVEGSKRVPPSPEVRERLKRLVNTGPSRLRATATVVDFSGFKGSITRGVVTSLDIAHGIHGRKTFDNVREATKWIAEQLGRDQSFGDKFHSEVIAIRERLKDS